MNQSFWSSAAMANACVELSTVAGHYFFKASKEMPDYYGVTPSDEEVLDFYGIKSATNGLYDADQIQNRIRETADLCAQLALSQAKLLRLSPDTETLSELLDARSLREHKMVRPSCDARTMALLRSALMRTQSIAEYFTKMGRTPTLGTESSIIQFRLLCSGKKAGIFARDLGVVKKSPTIREGIIKLVEKDSTVDYHGMTLVDVGSKKMGSFLREDNILLML